MAADMLSRPPTEDRDKQDNNNLTLLPEEMFIQLQTDETPEPECDKLEQEVLQAQKCQKEEIKEWEIAHHLDYAPTDSHHQHP